MTDRSGCGLAELTVLQAVAGLSGGRKNAVSARVLDEVDRRIGLGPSCAYPMVCDLTKPWVIPVPFLISGEAGDRVFPWPAEPVHSECRMSRAGEGAEILALLSGGARLYEMPHAPAEWSTSPSVSKAQPTARAAMGPAAGKPWLSAKIAHAMRSSPPARLIARVAPVSVFAVRLARTWSVVASRVLSESGAATVHVGAAVRVTIHSGKATVSIAP